ncbi:MAG: class I SAM-dependent methyltransferase [Saprospiraceae bacterium]
MAYDQNYFRTVYPAKLEPSAYNDKLSRFWMYNLFEATGYDVAGKAVLDFGSGPGHLTRSIGAWCYDVSEYARELLEQDNRRIVTDLDAVADGFFDFVLSSHSLEHTLEPLAELVRLRRLLQPDGRLLLVLPIEPHPGPVALRPDLHGHVYSWNFQNITNLLDAAGFAVEHQSVVYGPTGLRFFFNMHTVRQLGRLRRLWPSMLTVAQNNL